MAFLTTRLGVVPASVHIVVDGAGWRPELAPSFEPFSPSVLSIDPWPPLAADRSGETRLGWLASRFPERPLLGLTSRALVDEDGVPLRGNSLLGRGVALVSRDGLTFETLAGVIRHEMAHALGMEHCPSRECALGERPWPIPVEDRPRTLCPRCEALWLERLGEVSP